jgi:hypothetical protein
VLDDSPRLFAGGPSKWANLVLCEPEHGLDDPRVKDELNRFIAGGGKDDELGALDFERVDMADLIAQMKSR